MAIACLAAGGRFFVLSGQPDILVGLFSWPGYDGGSRENVALFGARTRKKNCSPTTSNDHV
jgi:hypothetical protein